MRDRSKIVKMITLISQIGITMLSSIFLCGGIGYLIDNRFGTHTFIFALLLGIAGGYRAVYSLVRQFIDKDRQDMEQDSIKGPTEGPVEESEDIINDDLDDI